MSALKRLKQRIRPWFADGPLQPVLDVGAAVRRTGERVRFAVRGRPSAEEAIVLAGSGRSGTTWLAELLTEVPGMYQVFEPLYARWVRGVRSLPHVHPEGPYPSAEGVYLRPGQDHPAWDRFLERALRGQVRCYWTDKLKDTPFPDRYLVKEVRANMLLGHLIDRFGSRVIYMIRHPGAVIASRVARGWATSLDHLLDQPDLVEDYLAPFADEIRAETRPVAIHAIWWAVENHVARAELASRPHCFVSFESMVLDPMAEVQRVFEWLGLDMPAEVARAVDRPSAMSRREYASVEDRLSSWRKDFTPDELDALFEWTEKLGFAEFRRDGVLPRVS